MKERRYSGLQDPESLRRFVERIQEGIYITSGEGEILDANPACLRIFGVRSLDELRENRAEDVLVNPEQREWQMELLRREGEVRDFELQVRRADGEVRTVLDTCFAVRDPDGEETFLHGILIDISHRKNLERRLQEMAERDPLTGCYNRRYLTRMELRLAAEDHLDWGVIVFDVDHFKSYNDRYGHQAGDEVLVQTARFLSQYARDEDAVVRLGGDEFLVLLTGPHAAATAEVARRFLGAGQQAPAPLSQGWARRRGDEGVWRTIQRADEELLTDRAEKRGENGSPLDSRRWAGGEKGSAG